MVVRVHHHLRGPLRNGGRVVTALVHGPALAFVGGVGLGRIDLGRRFILHGRVLRLRLRVGNGRRFVDGRGIHRCGISGCGIHGRARVRHARRGIDASLHITGARVGRQQEANRGQGKCAAYPPPGRAAAATAMVVIVITAVIATMVATATIAATAPAPPASASHHRCACNGKRQRHDNHPACKPFHDLAPDSPPTAFRKRRAAIALLYCCACQCVRIKSGCKRYCYFK
jgi:hypothetical protein